MAGNQPSPPSSSTSSTDIEGLQGQLTLGQLVQAMEAITGSPVTILASGLRGLLIYHRFAQPPIVDPNLAIDAAVAQREADAVTEARDRTITNEAIERHRVSPKRAERINNTIYFNAFCEDNENYTVSWRP